MTSKPFFLTTAAISLILFAGSASAHPADSRNRAVLYHDTFHAHGPTRSAPMPRWMYRDRGFRRWYRHSSLRHDHRIPWWKLYRVYERQLAHRHFHGHRRYDYDYPHYRGYTGRRGYRADRRRH